MTHHSLSFGERYDPERLAIGPMVCHDDHLLGAGRGFDLHQHADLEIVSYVVSGALRHTDASGESVIVPAGSVAVLSTGDGAAGGVEHAEHATEDGLCRFVQAWVRPADEPGPTSYDVSTPAVEPGRPVEIARPRPDATLYALHLEPGSPAELPSGPLVHAYVATGALTRSSMAEPLAAGDAFEMTDQPAHTVAAGVPTLLLVWVFDSA